ncbi:unnamed protein product [Gadus morhua 'NCC']
MAAVSMEIRTEAPKKVSSEENIADLLQHSHLLQQAAGQQVTVSRLPVLGRVFRAVLQEQSYEEQAQLTEMRSNDRPLYTSDPLHGDDRVLYTSDRRSPWR